MSILKFESRTPRTLAEMYNYMVDVKKTDYESVFGIGVGAFGVVQEMEFIQRLYYKENLLHPYVQIIFSFDVDVCLEKSVLCGICKEIGSILVWDKRQLFGAVHYKNTNNIHCHYMINYINIDGASYRQAYSVIMYKQWANNILQKYQLNPINYFGIDNQYQMCI